LHTYGECIKWFDDNNIEYINSIPNLDAGSNVDLFKKSQIPNLFERFLIQLTMIFTSYGAEGGLFVMIGRRK
jgi:hypothetical protein